MKIHLFFLKSTLMVTILTSFWGISLAADEKNQNFLEAEETVKAHTEKNFSGLPTKSLVKAFCTQNPTCYHCEKLSTMFFCAQANLPSLTRAENDVLQKYCNHHTDNKDKWAGKHSSAIAYHIIKLGHDCHWSPQQTVAEISGANRLISKIKSTSKRF